MQTVTWDAAGLAVTPPAYGTWQFGEDRGPVDERAERARHTLAANRGASVAEPAVARVPAHPAVQVAVVAARTPAHLTQCPGVLGLAPSRSDLTETDDLMTTAAPFGGYTLEGTA
ncbi:hypothetical protein ACFWOX_12035 [Streptomyces sp. NPDC058467]|uniref:hypothetical protein n=1 Tax=Streptomyces sp. NPDC058467 TaxID=3346513 RepID=UPI003656F67D